MSQDKGNDDTYIGLPTALNRETRTRHVLNDEYSQPICGAKPHAFEYEKPSGLLAEFPEDFGDLRNDCGRCESMAVEEFVKEIESDYRTRELR